MKEKCFELSCVLCSFDRNERTEKNIIYRVYSILLWWAQFSGASSQKKTRMFDAHGIYRSKLAWTHTHTNTSEWKLWQCCTHFVYVYIGSSIWLYQNHQFIFSFHSVRLIWLIYCQRCTTTNTHTRCELLCRLPNIWLKSNDSRNMTGFDSHFNNIVARISGEENQHTYKCDFSHFERIVEKTRRNHLI